MNRGGSPASVRALRKTCAMCGGPLDPPVPHHYDFWQNCQGCTDLLSLREAYRPRTRAEHDGHMKFAHKLVVRPRDTGWQEQSLSKGPTAT